MSVASAARETAQDIRRLADDIFGAGTKYPDEEAHARHFTVAAAWDRFATVLEKEGL